MINTSIPTNHCKQIQFKSADVLGIYLKTDERNFLIINAYNNCNNNNTITVVREFLDTKFPDAYIPDDIHIILCGDFNRHHPW